MIRWFISSAVLNSVFIFSMAPFAMQGIAFATPIDAVRTTVYEWADAWKSKDIIRYTSFYSPAFFSKGTDYQHWLNKKAQQFQTPANIEVNISDLWVFIEGKEATARFIQRYQDANTTDIGEKTLHLVHENDKWMITFEEWTPLKTSATATEKPAATNQQMPDPEPDTADNANKNQQKLHPNAIIVKNINFNIENMTEKVCLNLNPFIIPEIFTLENEKPRIVADIKNVYDWTGPYTIPVNGKFIKQIRTHLHRKINKLRIVLDLNPAEDYIIDQSYNPAEYLYCVEIK